MAGFDANMSPNMSPNICSNNRMMYRMEPLNQPVVDLISVAFIALVLPLTLIPVAVMLMRQFGLIGYNIMSGGWE